MRRSTGEKMVDYASMRRSLPRIPRTFCVPVCAAVVALGVGCASKPPETAIVVPTAATTAPEYRGDGAVPRQRYVIRMSDGQRDWEVEFPEVATGYEIRIPLKNAPQARRDMLWESEDLTDADKELLEQLRRENPNFEREGVYVDGTKVGEPEGRNEVGGFEPGAELDAEGRTVRNPGDVAPQGSGEANAAPSRPSYLLGIEEVQRLFKSQNYELAMVRLTQLEKAYPNDTRILAMKGSLWLKLGREELARETWERVLQIDPENKAVLEALKRLDG